MSIFFQFWLIYKCSQRNEHEFKALLESEAEFSFDFKPNYRKKELADNIVLKYFGHYEGLNKLIYINYLLFHL